MKKYLFGLIALVVATASVAFKAETFRLLPPCEEPNAWFKYTGPAFRDATQDPSVTIAQLRNPANYTLLAAPPEVPCDDVVYFCAICAPIDESNPTKPLITNTASTNELYDWLATYRSTGIPPVNVIVEKTLATE